MAWLLWPPQIIRFCLLYKSFPKKRIRFTVIVQKVAFLQKLNLFMLPNLIYAPFTPVEQNYYALLKLMKGKHRTKVIKYIKKITLKSVDGAF